ncbi:hypothetical protein RI367_007106 [Sorochytrium milnesiophthora]
MENSGQQRTGTNAPPDAIADQLKRHPLLPLLSAAVALRHSAAVATDTRRIQVILSQLCNQLETHLSQYSESRKGGASAAGADEQLDRTVEAALVITLSHVLDIKEQQEQMDQEINAMLDEANGEFERVALMPMQQQSTTDDEPAAQPAPALTPQSTTTRKRNIDETDDRADGAASYDSLSSADTGLPYELCSSLTSDLSGVTLVANPPASAYPSSLRYDLPLDEAAGKRTKRDNHPGHVSQILREWIEQHMDDPYPTEEQKRILCSLTDLNKGQLDHWFINARRRLVKRAPSNEPANTAAAAETSSPLPLYGSSTHSLTELLENLATSHHTR